MGLKESRVREIVLEEFARSRAPSPATGSRLRCSFCGKGNEEVLVLIAGPTVFICDECVDLSMHIVTAKRSEALSVREGSREEPKTGTTRQLSPREESSKHLRF